MNERGNAYFRKAFDDDEINSFDLIRRIPSSEARRFLLGYNALIDNDRILLKHAISLRTSQYFLDFEHRTFPYQQARLLNQFYADLPYPTSIHPSDFRKAKANDIRKVAKLAFSQLLGAQPQKTDEPGDWLYAGVFEGKPVTLRIRYSTRMGQIVYSLNMDDNNPYKDFNYEMLMGVGIGAWDLVDEAQIDQILSFMKDLLCLTIRRYSVAKSLMHN